MRPLIAALAVLLAAAPLTGFASDIASRSLEMKGARAILVDGPGLDAQIRVVGLREATPLWFAIVGSTGMNGEAVDAPAADGGRACFRVSVIFPFPDLEGVSDDELTTEHAHRTYWLYPAVEQNPAVLVAEEGAYTPVELLKTRLSEHGLPMGASHDRRTGPCIRGALR